jgi:hypothetical protein
LTVTAISSTLEELDRGAAAMSSHAGFPESASGTRAKGAFGFAAEIAVVTETPAVGVQV